MFVALPQIVIIGEIMGRLHRFYHSTALFTDHLIRCSVFVRFLSRETFKMFCHCHPFDAVF